MLRRRWVEIPRVAAFPGGSGRVVVVASQPGAAKISSAARSGVDDVGLLGCCDLRPLALVGSCGARSGRSAGGDRS
jgi:hypothetical protein